MKNENQNEVMVQGTETSNAMEVLTQLAQIDPKIEAKVKAMVEREKQKVAQYVEKLKVKAEAEAIKLAQKAEADKLQAEADAVNQAIREQAMSELNEELLGIQEQIERLTIRANELKAGVKNLQKLGSKNDTFWKKFKSLEDAQAFQVLKDAEGCKTWLQDFSDETVPFYKIKFRTPAVA